jgi:hypothetical protein
MEDDIIGKIIFTEERLSDKYDPNYYVYVFIKEKELPIGDFDNDKFVYSLDQGIEISEIKKPKMQVPQEIRRWKGAFGKVEPNEWNLYLLTIYSKLDKEDTEYKIDSWLKEEGYHVSVFVYNTPKVLERKVTKIPITRGMLDNVLKHKQVE